MARRSEAAVDLPKKVDEIRHLLDTFLNRLEEDNLRQRVLNLVPAFHALRDLGSGLIVEDGVTSARDRILAYFRRYPRVVIAGDELLVVAGISEWARRVRELRVEAGWSIYTGATLSEFAKDSPEVIEELETVIGVRANTLSPNQYVLMKDDQDREAAFRWKQLNAIRKKAGGVKIKLLEYLRLNAGHVVTGEELRYLARDNKEWARRIRELRTEDGWPVYTRMQGRPDLEVGDYLLDEDRQAPEHDRTISDDVRVKVLTRDEFSCTFCGWKRENLTRDDPRKFLELHHLMEHSKGGENSAGNLVTLCNVHHDQVHRGSLLWTGSIWKES